jgi:hypothetical protein
MRFSAVIVIMAFSSLNVSDVMALGRLIFMPGWNIKLDVNIKNMRS